MGKISSYPSDANVTTSDRLIGSDNENSNETKNFEIGDIITLAASIIGPNFVPYSGATNDVNLGGYEITSSAGYLSDIYTDDIFPLSGSGTIFIGGGGAYGGVKIETSSNIYKFGDFDANVNGTSIQIFDSQQQIQFGGGFYVGNGEGAVGQVLTSNGAGSTPNWVDVNTLITSNLYKGNFYDSITQTLAAANTATPVILNNTDAPTTNGISIVTDGTNLSRITFANSGVYNILFSAQLSNSGGSSQTVDFWLRKNGSTAAANIAHTNGKVQLQGNASFLMAAWNYFVDVAAGDYIQLVWAATSTNITMVAAAANGVHPETPSIIVTANVV